MPLVLSIEIRVAGVLTDADNEAGATGAASTVVTLHDPTATFGIKRTDTSAVIAASGTAMTHDGTGLYSYTIASPVAGVTYEYWPKFTVSGSPINYQQTKTFAGGTAAGTYADDDDLSDWYGYENITAYSDLTNTGTRDTARIQKWLDKADAWINLAFSRAGRITPIQGTSNDFSALTDVAAEWAGAMLAKGRGDLPNGFSKPDSFDDVMDGHLERARARLAELVQWWEEANDTGVSGVGEWSFIPTRRRAWAADENSQ